MSASSPAAAAPALTSTRARVGRWARLGVATAAALGAAALMRLSWHGSGTAPLWLPTVFLGISALLLHHRVVGSQLVARATWWSTLVLGTLLSVASHGSEGRKGLCLALTAGTALLAMGRLGLDEGEGSAFRPVAFRATLTLGMIMAVADAQALLFFAALKLQPGGWKDSQLDRLPQILVLLVSAGVLVVAIAGLYRLRGWGLLLATLCAMGVAVLSATNVYGVPHPFQVALMLTSLAQVALPLPILVTIFRRRAVPPATAPSAFARLALSALVALLMLVSTLNVVVYG